MPGHAADPSQNDVGGGQQDPQSHQQVASPSPPAQQPPQDIDGNGTTISMPKDAFDARIERATRAAQAKLLKDLGFDSMDAFKSFKESADTQAAQAEEKRLAEMSEIERYKSELEASRQKIADITAAQKQAEAEAEAARIQSHIQNLCHQRGIKNIDYAFFMLEKAVKDLPNDDDDLDEVKFLDDLVEEETHKSALGIAQQTPQPIPASTGPQQTGPNPQQPQTQQPKSALEMTPEEWQQHLKTLGL